MNGNAASKNNTGFSGLVEIMARLRSPEGCPWDREQDHRSLRECLLEEAHEVLEAIDADDLESLREELGDLLLQIVFHAQLAAEAGSFTIDDVIEGLRGKLVSRHPHVFAAATAETADEVVEQWDHLKQRERGMPADRIAAPPRGLPALSRARVAQRRAARVVGARPASEVRASIDSGIARLTGQLDEAGAAEAVVGDLLFAVVELAGTSGVDAEQALREHVNRFLEEVRETASASAADSGAPTGGADAG